MRALGDLNITVGVLEAGIGDEDYNSILSTEDDLSPNVVQMWIEKILPLLLLN